MADDQIKVQKESLQNVLSIQQNLLESADIIKKSVSLTGLLGESFNNIARQTGTINSTLNEIVKIESDQTKTLFTYNRMKAIENKLASEIAAATARKAVFEKGVNVVAVKSYTAQVSFLKQQKEKQQEIHDLLQKGDLTQEEAYKNRVKQFQVTQNIKFAEADIVEREKDKVVNEYKLLALQEESLIATKEEVGELANQSLSWKSLIPTLDVVGKKLGKLDVVKGLLGGLGLAGGIAGIFKSMVDTVFKMDTAMTGVSKSSGVTKGFSDAIFNNYRGISRNVEIYSNILDKGLVTIQGMLKAQSELQDASGQMSMFTNQRVQDEMALTDQYGLQVDDAVKLGQLGILNSKTTSAVTDDVIAQTANFNTQYKIRLDSRNILKEVAKIEGALAVQYKNNPKLLAAAVAQSEALGVSLTQSSQAANSLLDFESSIANQLEAELLTGKKFNLEKARSLALDGDAAGAAKEMLKNVGSLADFQKQNVISRQAEAKAIGMTVDELSNALVKEEMMSKLSVETKKAYEEQIKSLSSSADKAKYMAEINSATNADQMKAILQRIPLQVEYEKSMERVKESIGLMASGPLMSVLNSFVKITEDAGRLKAILVSASAYMGAIAVRSMITAFFSEATAATMGNWIGLATGAGALAAGIVAYSAIDTTPVKDALIAPSGQMMISTPEGKLIQPAKNDYVATSTDPSVFTGGNRGGGKTDQLLSAILNAVSKPSGVYMDSHKVGTALGQSYSAYA